MLIHCLCRIRNELFHSSKWTGIWRLHPHTKKNHRHSQYNNNTIDNGTISMENSKMYVFFLIQIRQHVGYPVVNDPLYNHEVFGPLKGRGGDIGGKTDEQLVRDLINIHNAENWLGIDGDSELSLFKTMKSDSDDGLGSLTGKGKDYNYF